MTRRRWRQDPVTHELIEVDVDAPRDVGRQGDATLWNDRHYADLRTTDGVDISSRTKHRQYMKQHGLTTYDDYSGEFARRTADRERYLSGERGGVSRQAIERALYESARRR